MGSNNKPILVSTPADIGTPQVYFKGKNFDDFLYAHGYNATIEHTLRCPCLVKGMGQPLTDCINCGGSGYVFLDKRQTIIGCQSLSNMTRYSVWSKENAGTMSVTYRAADKVGFMDRLVLTQLNSWFSEVVYPQKYIVGGDEKLFAFLIYPPIEIFHAYLFVNTSTKLTYLIEGTDFSIEDNKIIFDSSYNGLENMSVSLRYSHYPAYHVIDINRDLIRQPAQENCDGTLEDKNLPLHCIARIAHYMLDAPNYNGERVVDNTNYDVPPIDYNL